jgi:addiction module HigA family antidote
MSGRGLVGAAAGEARKRRSPSARQDPEFAENHNRIYELGLGEGRHVSAKRCRQKHIRWRRLTYRVRSATVACDPKLQRQLTMARTPIHPGEILADELEEIGLTATELARLLEVPPNRISQIASGKRAITADTALRLARYFGTSPDLWMNLQKTYELDQARREG